MFRNVFYGLKNGLNSVYVNFGNISFLFILIAIEVGLLLAGNSFFPQWDNTYGQLIMAYIVMTVIFLFWAKKRTQTALRMPISKALFVFVMFLIFTWGILILLVHLGLIVPGKSFDTSLLTQIIIIQFCVVSTSEELMFRGVMLDVLSRGHKISTFAIVGQAIVFAIYHSWAYQIVWYDMTWSSIELSALVIAFFIAIILGVIASNKNWGLPATIAIHGVYNLVILGALVI